MQSARRNGGFCISGSAAQRETEHSVRRIRDTRNWRTHMATAVRIISVALDLRFRDRQPPSIFTALGLDPSA